MHNRTWLASCLLAVAPALHAQSYIRSDDRFIYAGNGQVELSFQKSDGRWGALLDKSSKLDFLKQRPAWGGPFVLWIDVAGKEEQLSTGSARNFASQTQSSNDLSTLTLTWDQFRTASSAPLNVQVRITIEVPSAGGLTYWRVSVTNNEDRFLRRMAVPNLEGLPQLSADPKNDYFAFPSFSGLLFQDPLHNFRDGRGHGWELYYPSGLAAMQFSAYYSSEKRAGLYLAVQDPGGNSKFLNIGKSPDWLSLNVTHPLPHVARRGFTPAYQTAVGVFSGDWYDAAQLYRNWAVQQDWFRNASLQRKDGAPDWFRKLALHEWQHTYHECREDTYANVWRRAQSSSDRMAAPVAADWVGWERFAWYIDYPKVFPPKEGWASFDQTVARVQEFGNRVWLVPNTGSFSSRLPEWEQARAAALLDAQGNLPAPYEYGECGQRTGFYQMCPGTAYWQKEVRTLVEELARRNVDIIQLDGFPVQAMPCYATTHGHAPGAPDLQATAYRALFDSVKAEARRVNPKIQLSSEGMAEYYLDILDSAWDPASTGWSPANLAGGVQDPLKVQLIPLWHAVYHDASLIQSGISLIQRRDSAVPNAEMETDYYVRGLARALVWGEVPHFAANRDLAILDAPSEKAVLDYMQRIVHARQGYASQFLTTGRMLRPPALTVPEIGLPGAVNIPYTGATYPPSTSPAVLGSLWRAPNGDAGYVFTNISRADVSFELAVTGADTLLPNTGVYDVYLVRNGAFSLAEAAVTLPRKLTLTLAPRDVLLAGVVPSSGGAAAPRVAPGGFVNASSYTDDGIAPGQIFTLFGAGMGPRELAGLTLAADGRVATELAGARVLFDGVAAPLIYAHDRQVSGIAPYGIADKATTQVQVEYRGVKSRALAAPVRATAPGIFTLDASGRGPGVVWNQNGSINSKSNPAARGDIIAFWATGEGAVTPDAADGQVTGAVAPRPKAPVTVRIDGIEAEILYAAAAPQAVAGVFQVNVRVPQAARAGDALPLVLTAGGVRSQAGVTVALK